jgi:periplasmic protein TonB
MGLFFPDYGSAYGKAATPKLSLLGVLAGHAVLLGLVAVAVPAAPLSELARPFTARLIEAVPEVAPPPPPPPPSKQPPRRVRAAAPPVLAATVPTPSPAAASFTVAAQVPAPAAPVSITAPAAPPVTTAARFDADYLDNPKPLYPHASRRLREEGRVLLRVRVNAAGLAESVELKHSSGFPRLDEAAEDAVSRWRFVPARRGDEAVAAWVQVPITFNLQG